MIETLIQAAFPLARPILHGLDAETAHDVTLRGLSVLPPRRPEPDDPALAVDLFGQRFPNPVGLAAGFDKGARVADAMLGLGFGFVEVGGVVPRPQPGNPRPRVFRLTRDRAVINRFGLNSEGLDPVADRLKARSGRPGIVGVNIGANKDSQDRLADYVACTERLAPHVAFLTVNVSSPNTPGLRDLQGEAFLDDLLARVVAARDASGARPAVLLKIAPDIALDGLDAMTGTALRRGIDGLVVSNTTVARPVTLTESALAAETGGLSGRPLFAARRGSWPRPSCGWGIASRSSGSAVLIRPRPPGPRSAPAPDCSSSIPPSSTRDRGSSGRSSGGSSSGFGPRA